MAKTEKVHGLRCVQGEWTSLCGVNERGYLNNQPKVAIPPATDPKWRFWKLTQDQMQRVVTCKRCIAFIDPVRARRWAQNVQSHKTNKPKPDKGDPLPHPPEPEIYDRNVVIEAMSEKGRMYASIANFFEMLAGKLSG